MKVSQIRLENYSAFVDSGWIELAPGLNVITGQNNSGKTSLLEALNITLLNKPHRDQDSFLPGSLKIPRISMDILSTTEEFRRRLAGINDQVVTTIGSGSDADRQQLLQILMETNDLHFKCQAIGGQGITSREITFQNRFGDAASQIVNLKFIDGQLTVENYGSGRSDTMINAFCAGYSPSIFNFSAQRLNVSRSGFATEAQLRADASNLPGFLAYLFGNKRALYEEIEERVREVIPSVGGITIAPENGCFEILLWPDKTTRARELAFSLADSGTGVAQVIAMITAIVTAESSLIVIDEINSFLHPAAVKKLLQICMTFYSQHQYVVSSHSSDVINFSGVDRLIVVERTGFVSSVKTLQRGDLTELKSAMRHLGVSMMDVLGSDRVVWVEGPTEEIAFPSLLTRANVPLPEGLSFTAVAATGDFNRKGSSKKAVMDLYKAATHAVAPLMDGEAFVLDRETLSDQAVMDVHRQTDGRLRLLPRRCLECYALSPAAIATVLNAEASDGMVTEQTVRAEIERLGNDRLYGAATKWNGHLDNKEWLKRVDGATLLKDLFANLSEHKLEFRKTLHTPQILSARNMSELSDLTIFLKRAVAAASKNPRGPEKLTSSS